eukprot:TRINITY_DN507_c0_g1_i3.p1 TRINITY_DN507_c0_g1~~TRINITY_DN507_c0_g1_i3.p1  ORF type:complete len:472 (+),score=46.66 TRINITY_DN507_c0_g1_i3:814-2229(+)
MNQLLELQQVQLQVSQCAIQKNYPSNQNSLSLYAQQSEWCSASSSQAFMNQNTFQQQSTVTCVGKGGVMIAQTITQMFSFHIQHPFYSELLAPLWYLQIQIPAFLGYAFLIIIVGVTFRWLSTILSTLQKKYCWGEKLFMAFAWLPKATVQAALGGNILEKAKAEHNDEYIDFGNKILTISILCILLTSPPCAIATIILGKKFLPRKKTLNESEEEGFVMGEQDETIINEIINQEIPGVEISDSVKSKLQLSVAKSRMRRARMRNLVASPDSPTMHYILATHKMENQDNIIQEENEFGIDLQAEQNRPRIKSGEAQHQKLSTADQGNSEESPTKQHSRRNSMISVSHHGSQQSLSSIGFSVGDIQEQQLEQIHQINQKWKEQKIKHMQNGDKQDQSESYDTWERSFEDLQNKKVNESDADDIRLQESQQQEDEDQNQRKFSEHQVSEMQREDDSQECGSVPTESAQLNPIE